MFSFANYQPFNGGNMQAGENRAVPSFGPESMPSLPQNTPLPIDQSNQSDHSLTNKLYDSAGKQIGDALGTSDDQKTAIHQYLASQGNPISQSVLSQPATPPAGSSQLMGGIGQNMAAGIDNSDAGQFVNGVAGNSAGNGFAQQGMSGLSSLFGSGADASGAAGAMGAGADAAGGAAADTAGSGALDDIISLLLL